MMKDDANGCFPFQTGLLCRFHYNIQKKPQVWLACSYSCNLTLNPGSIGKALQNPHT